MAYDQQARNAHEQKANLPTLALDRVEARGEHLAIYAQTGSPTMSSNITTPWSKQLTRLEKRSHRRQIQFAGMRDWAHVGSSEKPWE